MYYYWTLRSHPDAQTDYFADGLLSAPTDHAAHSMVKQFEEDHGVAIDDSIFPLISPVESLVERVRSERDDDGNSPDGLTEREEERVLQSARSTITDADIREVAGRAYSQNTVTVERD